MKLKYLLAASVVSLTAATTIAAPAAAQQITSGIEGQVSDESGAALPGATVTITDERTQSSRTVTTGAAGNFRVGSLPPGGPYTVTVTANGYEGQTVEEVFTSISGNTGFNFTLSATAAGAADNVIVVTGARAQVTQLAVGPGTAFDTQTLEAFPSITRDVRDIIRIDPRVSLERNNDVDRISCLGGNDRGNTFTVDGIIQSDVFGLNGTPFAARNSLPLPYDVIEQTSVEFAPFDVEYSDFTGCLVNVVTKAGSNRFSGSAFITYFDGGMQADEVEQADGSVDPFNAGEEKRWGVTLSGPIIPDRLFFSFGYEETDLGDGFNGGPGTTGVDFFTQAQFDRFAQIASSVYGQDIGGIPTQLPESNVRYFGRIDANISDDHRLEATYQRLEETNVEPDFGRDNFGGLNSFEDEGTISDYYSLRLYSDWSDTVSTELRISRAEVGDVQGPVGFGEAQSENPTVRLVVGVDGPGDIGTLSTGPGIFRSANQLDTKIDQARFILNVDAGDGHFLKFGTEINDLEVFNLFAINATGSLYFQNLDDFEAGLLSPGDEFFPNNDEIFFGDAYAADINVAPGFDINNAAALFSRRTYSVFAQDEWQATDQLSVTAGVRVQLYDGDAPRVNPLFQQRFGFTNAVSFGKLDPVVLPRLAATYEFDNDGFFSNSRLTAGVGIFSGGDPVVYFSNAFSNNGFSTGLGTSNSCSDAELNRNADGKPQVLVNGQFTGIPQCVVAAGEARASAGRADVQSIDPNLDIPTAVRANLGFATDLGGDGGFFGGWKLNLDYIYTRFNDNLAVVDLVQVVDPSLGNNGFTVDGRPIYRPIDPIAPGCNAVLQGTGGVPPTYSNVTDACFAALNPDGTRGRGVGVDDFLQLTNGPSFDSHNASLILRKRFSEGVLTEGGSVSVNLGYAFTDSQQTINFRSSTATSTFDNTPAFDRQNLAVSQSGFETRHNFTASLYFREEFIDGFDTGLGIFFRASEGRPYSLVFDDGRPFFNDSNSREENALLYVPTGIDDPNIAPPVFDANGVWTGDGSDPAAVAQLLAALENGEGIVSDLNCNFTRGETVKRNQCRNDWFFDLDMRFSQELPFIGTLTGITEDRIELFVDFDNFLNLLDSGWNTRRALGGFDGRVDLVDGAFDDQGRYVITNFNPGSGEANTFESSTAWRIQIGARYEF
ncbi:TonB-dependent receptor [Erythrobacter sp. THAF29]|uniref:TonB-dependent receptor n=1 Tax=Erythrobacter sp. THAF29 TaxID=2587851 RepID=UPI00126785A9|nr:TonB-dependent receptor [Erythrobacter sp. THAF29]QFT76762.1 Cna protein B-type domain protein [Erythrobacter sp. THAF29]